ncbi:hypothetical protein GCM10008967_26420 [Bacillus carboniphilus]|uniref:RNA polymerase subunit sigma-70 n=1 Tax=Bacillus carboniphilus TaxID=86663 RepID=A0ABN0WE46_9BACI
MRIDHNKNIAHRQKQEAFGVNLHDPLSKELSMEMATEFGVSAHNIRKLKRHLR